MRFLRILNGMGTKICKSSLFWYIFAPNFGKSQKVLRPFVLFLKQQQ